MHHRSPPSKFRLFQALHRSKNSEATKSPTEAKEHHRRNDSPLIPWFVACELVDTSQNAAFRCGAVQVRPGKNWRAYNVTRSVDRYGFCCVPLVKVAVPRVERLDLRTHFFDMTMTTPRVHIYLPDLTLIDR